MNYMNMNRGNQMADCDKTSSLNTDPLRGMPLGMGYVPWQEWRNTYPVNEGLANGTIFPCLNLPFYGCIPRGFRSRRGGRA